MPNSRLRWAIQDATGYLPKPRSRLVAQNGKRNAVHPVKSPSYDAFCVVIMQRRGRSNADDKVVSYRMRRGLTQIPRDPKRSFWPACQLRIESRPARWRWPPTHQARVGHLDLGIYRRLWCCDACRFFPNNFPISRCMVWPLSPPNPCASEGRSTEDRLTGGRWAVLPCPWQLLEVCHVGSCTVDPHPKDTASQFPGGTLPRGSAYAPEGPAGRARGCSSNSGGLSRPARQPIARSRSGDHPHHPLG
jgi:hypothetical protein